MIHLSYTLVTIMAVDDMGTLLFTWIDFIPAWMNYYIHQNVWDEITYPFPNFNGFTVEVWQWISNFIPRFMMDVITYLCLD